MKKKSGQILLGFLAGAAAGALAGIILAPNKGKDTRQNIANKASQFKDEFGVTVLKGVEKFNTLKDSAFSLINKYGDETKAGNESDPFKNPNLN
jgi:gas vesicle protein